MANTEATLTRAQLAMGLRARLAAACGVDEQDIDDDERLSRYGLDSFKAVGLVAALREWLACELAPTLVWDHPTIAGLVEHLVDELTDARTRASMTARRPKASHVSDGLGAQPIAIVGMACSFPQASDLAGYWRVLIEGVDAIRPTPSERWDADALFDADRLVPGKLSTRWGGFIDGVDEFEPGFFGISPREAEQIDPQQRVMLELSWAALEDAGIVATRLRGGDTGVFFGAMWNDYARIARPTLDAITPHTATGHDLGLIAGRVSYVLGLQGPSLVVNTACSSSLVAVHLACQSLRTGESSLALAGGVSLMLDPESTVMMSKFGAMAPDGRSKAFDARANGYVRGEGAGVVVLKPLTQALLDGDRIYCVIQGSASNNDGMSNGLTAPNPKAQVEVLHRAYARAQVHPSRVQYVETHGTGTLLGDPIEAGALGSVLGSGRAEDQPLRIGSVKTNIGHLEAAAGIAGLIKTALALAHRVLPPSLNFEQPNPHIDFARLRLRVQDRVEPWPADGGQALAGVSSFGFGGTNCHVVLAGVPAQDVGIVPLAAESEVQLREAARRLRARVGQPSLAALCHAAAREPDSGDQRVTLTLRSIDALEPMLASLLDGRGPVGCARGHGPARAPKLVFMFGGQGSQWLAMGRELIEREPVVREQLQLCASAMADLVDWSLRSMLCEPHTAVLERSEVAQPCIFAMQVALAALWRSWGIEPIAVVGQSMGEVAAAHVAGALSLVDAARVICSRSRIVTRARGRGGMALVELSLAETRAALQRFGERLSVAVSSSPRATVISGDVDALDELLAALERDGVTQRRIKVDYASHSAHMDPLRDELATALAGLQPRATSLPLISTVTGAVIDGRELEAGYWVRNLREPVLFAGACERLLADGCDAFIDVNPHPLLVGALEQTAAASGREALALPSMRRDEPSRSVLLDSLGSLWVRGAELHWPLISPAVSVAMPATLDAMPRTGSSVEADAAGEAQLFVISAHSAEALQARVRSWAAWLRAKPQLSLVDVAYTAAVRRSHLPHRLAVVERSSAALATTLESRASRSSANATRREGNRRPRIVFVFPGQGGQWLGMGRGLFMREPVFRAAIEACEAALQPWVRWSLVAELFADEHDSRLAELDVVQPMLWAMEVALASLWRSWGVEPDAVVGHSMGEIAAAHVAGALSLEDAARVIALRSKLVRERASGNGGMALVELSFEHAREAIAGFEDQLAVAVNNGPRASVLAGAREPLERVLAALRERDVFCRAVNVDYASHSPQMDALRPALLDALAPIRPQHAAVPMMSTIHAGWIADTRLDGAYWAANLRQPVRFADAIGELARSGHELFLELSPHPLLRPSIEDQLRAGGHDALALVSMRRGEDERANLLAALAALYERGLTPSFERVFAAGGRVLSPPSYPWQRERVWPRPRPSNTVVREPKAVREPKVVLGSPLDARTEAMPHDGHAQAHAQTHTQEWTASLRTDAPTYLAEHRVSGAVWVPAAMIAEQMFAAMRERFAARAVGVDELAMHAPLVLHEGHTLHTRLTLDGTRLRLHARTQASEPWTLHASATVALDAELEPRRVAIAELSVGTQRSAARHHELLRRQGLDYGPSFAGVQQLWLASERVVSGRVELTTPSPGEPALMHVPLLDACLQVAFALVPDTLEGGRPFVPTRVAALRRARGAASSCSWVRARQIGGDPRAGHLRVDVELFDHDGHLLMELRELVFQRLMPATDEADDELLLTHEWQRVDAAEPPPWPVPRAWLVIGHGELAQELGRRLHARGAKLTVLHPHADARVGEVSVVQLPTTPSDCEQQLRELLREHAELGHRGLLGVVWVADEIGPTEEPRAAIDVSVTVLGWVQALARAATDTQVRTWLLTRGAQSVAPERAPKLGQAPIWGLGQTLMYEHPDLRCTLLDALDVDAERIVDELLAGSDEPRVALRSASRLVGRLVRARLRASSSLELRADASYLISGGFGGLGLALARELVDRGARNLVLLGRRGPVDVAQRDAVAALEAAGATIMVARVDVSVRDELAATLAEVARRMPPLRGVVHAAGLLDDAVILQQTRERFERVMAPKLLGAANLDALTDALPLDWFVLYSSASALIGSPGQANYAAANAYLDALAQARRARGRPGLAIAWGPIAEVGLASAQDNRGSRLAARGMGSLALVRAHACFGRLLVDAPAHVGVVELDVERWLSAYPAMAARPLFSLLRTSTSTPVATPPANESSARWTARELEALICAQAIEVLRVSSEHVHRTTDLMSLGVDSLLGLELRNSLEAELGLKLPVSLFWEHPRVDRLAAHLVELAAEQLGARPASEQLGARPASEQPDPVAAPTPESKPATPPPAPIQPDRVGQRETAAIRSSARAAPEPIAIIGISGRYPKAGDLDELWARLESGENCVEPIPAARWSVHDGDVGRVGGFIDDVADFDPGLFQLSPRAALEMEPSERLLLETAWRTFEDAGGDSRRERHVGVFVGAMYGQYAWLADESLRRTTLFNNSYFALANRISHFFDLRGPSVAIDTACSSSTVAIHMACESLRAGECALALAGGVNLTLHPDKYVGLQAYGMLASESVNRALGQGDGFVPGEGVGLVLLKPLAAALRDGDRIDAVIRSSAINHNGRGMGYTAPSPVVQAELIERALARVELSLRDIDYVELAANGSPLADEGELVALTSLLRKHPRASALPVGTIKNNIGHLEAASGISQLSKVLLQLRHARLAPSIHTEPRNPHLPLDDGKLSVQTEARAWPSPAGRPRRVLIDSFGGGGAGACLIVEEHVVPATASSTTPASGPWLLVFSAPDAERLTLLLESFERWSSTATVEVRDLAHTLLCGRAVLDHRLAFTASSMAEVHERLAAVRRGHALEVVRGEMAPGVRPLQLFEDDEDLRETVARWLSKGRLDRLAQLWVSGIELDWRLLPESLRGRPIRAPGVPFERLRLWPQVAIERRSSPAPTDVEHHQPPRRDHAPDPGEALLRVREAVAVLLSLRGPEAVHPDEQLRRYGFDSLAAARLVNRLLPDGASPQLRQRLLASPTARAWAELLPPSPASDSELARLLDAVARGQLSPEAALLDADALAHTQESIEP